MDPVVTVLMPAYNCAPFIKESVSAILNQSFKSFEFLIINDGSTDSTKENILSYQDPRIRYYENEKNIGLIDTLNKGIGLSWGKYILRTDADDIAMPRMIADLVSFMETNKDYIVCGGFMKVLHNGKLMTYPTKDSALKVYTLNHCPFSHSTVIFRKSVLDDHQLLYSKAFLDGEDHGLWSEMLPYGKFYNLNKPTLLYRESESQITSNKEYANNYKLARKRIFLLQASLYFDLDKDSGDLYSKLIAGDNIDSLEELQAVGKVLVRIRNKNLKNKLFDNRELSNFLFIKWHWMCYHSYGLGKKAFRIYLKYMLAGGNIFRAKSILIHFIKRAKLI